MEEFKVCERETKTKAYSREGLAKAGKIDPEEKKRLETRAWVQEAIETLKRKVEENEFSIEELDGVRGSEEEMEEIVETLNNHNWHIEQLEHVTRGLDNEIVTPDMIDNIKDDIDYYITESAEPDFVFDDGVYEQLDMKKDFLPEKTIVIDNPPVKDKKVKKDRSKSKKKKKISDKDSVSTAKKEKLTAHEKLLEQQKERMRLLAEEEEKRKELKAKEKEKEKEIEELEKIEKAAEQNTQPKNFSQMFTKQPTPTAVPSVPSSPRIRVPSPVPQPRTASPLPTRILSPRPQVTSPLVNRTVDLQPVQSGPPSLNVLSPESQKMLLHSSYLHIPDKFDADQMYKYAPENPVQVPDFFPQSPSDLSFSAGTVENMDLDGLFFIFHNQPGTYHQYLAARELKLRKWNYHMQHNSWFQRQGEPSLKGQGFEVGNYIFFEAGSSWKKVLRENIKLEYKYRENEMIV